MMMMMMMMHDDHHDDDDDLSLYATVAHQGGCLAHTKNFPQFFAHTKQ